MEGIALATEFIGSVAYLGGGALLAIGACDSSPGPPESGLTGGKFG